MIVHRSRDTIVVKVCIQGCKIQDKKFDEIEFPLEERNRICSFLFRRFFQQFIERASVPKTHCV